MKPNTIRRLERIEAKVTPIRRGFCIRQIIDGDDRRPSDAAIQAQIAQAVERGLVRRAEDVRLVQLAIVDPVPQ